MDKSNMTLEEFINSNELLKSEYDVLSESGKSYLKSKNIMQMTPIDLLQTDEELYNYSETIPRKEGTVLVAAAGYEQKMRDYYALLSFIVTRFCQIANCFGDDAIDAQLIASFPFMDSEEKQRALSLFSETPDLEYKEKFMSEMSFVSKKHR